MKDAPDADELSAALLNEENPSMLAGHPGEAMVVTGRDAERGFIRLVVVHPTKRRRGIGSELVKLAESALGDVDSITVGADAPFYLYPGVDVENMAALCLFEKQRFRRAGTNINLRLPREAVSVVDTEHVIRADEAHGEAVLDFISREWPRYESEVSRSLSIGTLHIVRDDKTVVGFSAHSVVRKGWIGPVAVAGDLVGQGAGRALLAAAAKDVISRGLGDRMIVEWAGPLRPYARFGATVASTYVEYRKVPGGIHKIDEKRT